MLFFILPSEGSKLALRNELSRKSALRKHAIFHVNDRSLALLQFYNQIFYKDVCVHPFDFFRLRSGTFYRSIANASNNIQQN